MVIEKNFKNIDQKKILYFFSEHWKHVINSY
jgi:hypothetical protein